MEFGFGIGSECLNLESLPEFGNDLLSVRNTVPKAQIFRFAGSDMHTATNTSDGKLRERVNACSGRTFEWNV